MVRSALHRGRLLLTAKNIFGVRTDIVSLESLETALKYGLWFDMVLALGPFIEAIVQDIIVVLSGSWSCQGMRAARSALVDAEWALASSSILGDVLTDVFQELVLRHRMKGLIRGMSRRGRSSDAIIEWRVIIVTTFDRRLLQDVVRFLSDL